MNITEEIKNEYSFSRQKNLLEYEIRKNDVYEKYPKLKELDFQLISLYIEKAYDVEKNIDELINNVKKDRQDLIEKNNIEDNYLDVKYDCNKCKDTGYVNGEKCECYIKKQNKFLNKEFKFNEIVTNESLDNIDYSLYNKKIKISEDKTIDYKIYMKANIEEIKSDVANINIKPINMLFVGKVGTGKTYIAKCIGADCVKANKSVLFLNVIDYVKSIMPNYDGIPYENYSLMTDVLILDDLGMESITEFSATRINYLIDKRLTEGKSTIITTNYDFNEIADNYLKATASRVLNLYKKFIFLGEDLRRICNAN